MQPPSLTVSEARVARTFVVNDVMMLKSLQNCTLFLQPCFGDKKRTHRKY